MSQFTLFTFEKQNASIVEDKFFDLKIQIANLEQLIHGGRFINIKNSILSGNFPYELSMIQDEVYCYIRAQKDILSLSVSETEEIKVQQDLFSNVLSINNSIKTLVLFFIENHTKIPANFKPMSQKHYIRLYSEISSIMVRWLSVMPPMIELESEGE